MLRTIGFASTLILVAALAAGCERREAASPDQPPPNYAGQPGYGQPGYPSGPGAPPGYPQPQPQYPQPQPQYPQPQPQYPQPQPQYPAPQQPAPQQPAPQQPAPGGFPWPFPVPGQAPGGQPQPGGGSAGMAQPIDPAFASAATVPLNALAGTEAPGMKPEGPPIAGQFATGQILEQPLQMLPGKCYTVLAVGAGVSEVDLSLVALTPIPGMSPVLAQDSGTGTNASVGGRGNCYRWTAPIGINAKYVIKATAGSGIVAGQLYVK